MTYVHWFRRDLRLRDNPALAEALRRSGGRVLPVFILDDAALRAPDTGAARVAFMLESLRALDSALRERGSRLVVRRGPPAEALAALAREAGAAGVSWNRDYTPFARRRDARAAELLGAAGLEMLQRDDAVIVPPGEPRSGAGRPYTVFTPYRRAWRALVESRAASLAERPAPEVAPWSWPEVEPGALPTAAELGFDAGQELPPGGEAAGYARLEAFARERAAGYAAGRDLMAEPATSRLSPYLRMGCVAPAACLRAALRLVAERPAAADSVETWVGELAWRDFYYQIMAEFPHVLRSAFRPEYDAVAWENDPALFDAWREGRTGYPIVDAAMRQLEREAWVHNRARMVVASFLTKDLLVDWRWGERHYMRRLVDGDHAANNGGWQWAAGTGTDAQPYFRIFNPVSQGQKFDPRGDYVRRYVPELARVPDRYVHAPWTMPPAEQRAAGVSIPGDYPAPVVDHAERRARALAIYKAARDRG